MFTGGEHKFVDHEYIFKDGEHKFTAREYKKCRREKKTKWNNHQKTE
jgi:hypothetical protein